MKPRFLKTARRLALSAAFLSLGLLTGGPAMAESDGGWEPTLPVSTFTLQNGMQVVVLEQPGVPSFTATFLHQAGIAREWQGLKGSAHLVGEAMLDGTTRIGTSNWRREQSLLIELDGLDKDLRKIRQTLRDIEASGDDPTDAEITLQELDANFQTRLLEHEALVDDDAWLDAYQDIGGEGPEVEVGHDGITYTVTLPNSAFSSFIRLESQRLSDGVARSFYTDRSAMAEAWRMDWEEDPGYALFETLADLSYRSHPYSRYRGSASQLEGVARAELGYFMKSFTAPGRTILAVVGGISAGEVRQEANRYLGRVSGGGRPDELEGIEGMQRGEKRAVIRTDGAPEMVIGYHAGLMPPDLERRVLPVMVELLGHHTDGMLQQVLTFAGDNAGSVATALYPSGGPLGARDPGLLVMTLGLTNPNRACSVESSLWQALALLATQGPPDAALAAAKKRARERIRNLWSDHALMAPALAWVNLTHGGAEALLDQYEAIEMVTAKEIRDAAAVLFNPANRTVVLGWPQQLSGSEAGCAARSAASIR